MQIRRTRAADRAAEPDRAPARLIERVASGDAQAMVEQIDCCLAEVADEEQAARWAFDRLREAYTYGRISHSAMLDQGDILRARYAHTAYVQQKRCCTCGCPWNGR